MNKDRPRPPVALTRLARVLDMPLPKLLSFVRYRQIPTRVLDGFVTIRRFDAVTIFKWIRTCGVIQTARRLKVRESTPKRLISEGLLKAEIIFGKVRISLKSIEKLKEEGNLTRDVAFPEIRGFGRFCEEKRREIGRKAGKTKRRKEEETKRSIWIRPAESWACLVGKFYRCISMDICREKGVMVSTFS